MYIDNSDGVVNKYNNTYHSTIKMKPVDIKPSTYIDSSKEINDENPKFKTGDIFRISKYKKFFAKGYVTNGCEEIFVNKRVKNTVMFTYFISDLKGKEIVGVFHEKDSITEWTIFMSEIFKRKSESWIRFV